MPTKVKILVEKSEGAFCATAMDDVGTLATSSSSSKATAIRKVKEKCKDLVDDPQYTTQDMTSGTA